MKLINKTILVAGAGGIGSDLALRYAAEGANVILGDINLESAERAAAKHGTNPGSLTAIQLDGADENSVKNAVDFAISTYGALDGLHINFAFLGDNSFEHGVIELPMDIYDETQRVNARGFFVCTKVALPALIQSGGGSIVYTSSAAANASSPIQVAYAMSKAAGQALMRHVATRYGSVGIRANTIAPALTLHEGIEPYIPNELIDMAKGAAAIKSRVGNTNDLASMGALLMSDDGAYITGQVISIDGGTTMRC